MNTISMGGASDRVITTHAENRVEQGRHDQQGLAAVHLGQQPAHPGIPTV